MADLSSVRHANAHFSEDLLSGLLNEPIEGQGVFWSSVGGKPYPVPIRILSFEKMYPTIDPRYNKPEENTYAKSLRQKFLLELQSAERAVQPQGAQPQVVPKEEALEGAQSADVGVTDALRIYEEKAIQSLKDDSAMMEKIKGDGVAWGGLKHFLLSSLPSTLDDRDKIAYQLVPKALTEIFGPQNQGWNSFKKNNATYVKAEVNI
jgi:hypothetical protein